MTPDGRSHPPKIGYFNKKPAPMVVTPRNSMEKPVKSIIMRGSIRKFMQKSILITGCSSGIGLATAEILHQRGYSVFAAVRRESDQTHLKEKGIESLILDINDSNSIQQGLAQVLAKTDGTLDALFNNAGFAIPGAVEDISRDMMRKQFETNVFGTMELTNRVIPLMRKQGHGRIIQNTSILGIITMPYRGAYNASKFALEGFTNTLRQELRHTPIHVSAIVPGPIHSAFRKNAQKNFQETLQGKASEHATTYQKMQRYFFTQENGKQRLALPASAVAKQVIRALESRSPRAHYYVGAAAHLFAILRRLLPDSALDWVIDKTHQEEAR